METKTSKNYKYSGLGIDILLKEVTLVKINKEWVPKINVENLAKKVFSILIYKQAPFIGDELAFIRNYLQISKSEFGRELRVSHTAVAKWEKAGKKTTTMDLGTELLLKMIMAEKSGVASSKYQEIFQKTKEQRLSNKNEALIVLAA